MTYSAVDLFAGAGGLSNGFLQAGEFDIKAAVEIDKHSRATYKKNHPNTDLIKIKDIRNINFIEDILGEYGPIDIVIGGPPCQGFSNANRHNNTLISNNNELVKFYIKAIEQLRPIALIMENVKTLRSEKHKFFCSYKDKIELNELKIKTRNENVILGECNFLIEEIKQFISENHDLRSFLIPTPVFSKLKTILRHAKKQSSDSLHAFWQNRNNKNFFLKIFRDDNWLLQSKACWNKNYEFAWIDLREKIIECMNGDFNKERLLYDLQLIIEIQKIFMKCQELIDYRVICGDLIIKSNTISVQAETYNVFNYLINKLKTLGYRINEDNRYILNAADFGVPQIRHRLFIMGVHEKICVNNNVNLPKPVFKKQNYSRIKDAISDLEEIEPNINFKGDPMTYNRFEYGENTLMKYFRTGINNKLYNHVRTDSTSIAIERFKELGEGDNFHDLDDKFKSTYSNHKRTQNTIYKRLMYSKPSDTVVNVRKSMWIHPTKDRALSIREAARLQSFKDSFVFEGPKNSQYQQVGNAVPPLLAKAIAKHLLELLGLLSEQKEKPLVKS